MKNLRKVLEGSLEIFEKMDLITLQQYPNASLLIPQLRDLLEQEEICSHIFVDGVCICGTREQDVEVRENGPWHVINEGGMTKLKSEDIYHDVTLHITGDFLTHNQMYEYGKKIVEKLNSKP